MKDVIDVMLPEGVYAEGTAYESMCNEVKQSVQTLMDSGYTVDEASKECMNKSEWIRYAYDDEFILSIVLKAPKDYYESCGGKHESVETDVQPPLPETDLIEVLFREMAKEVGMEMSDVDLLKAIEEKINMFAEPSGKSRDAVVGS